MFLKLGLYKSLKLKWAKNRAHQAWWGSGAWIFFHILGSFMICEDSEGMGHSLQPVISLFQGELHSQQFSVIYIYIVVLFSY